MRRAGIRTDQHVRAIEQGEELLQCCLSDQVERRALRCHAADTGCVLRFQLRGSARQNHARAVDLCGVLGERGVVLDAPVTIVAKALARARADDERAAAGRDVAQGESAIVLAKGYVPSQQALLHAERLREAEQAVHHVLARARGDARVGKQMLVIAGTRPVEPEPHAGGNHEGREIGAERSVHHEQKVEAPPGQMPAQAHEAARCGRLVEHGELDAVDARHQRRLGPADDPREAGVRPRALQRAHDWQRMTGVADRGEAQDADILRGVIPEFLELRGHVRSDRAGAPHAIVRDDTRRRMGPARVRRRKGSGTARIAAAGNGAVAAGRY